MTERETRLQAPSEKQIDAIAAAGREIRRIRSAALANLSGGLRALYRTLDLPGKNPRATPTPRSTPPSSPPTAFLPRPICSNKCSPSTFKSPSA